MKARFQEFEARVKTAVCGLCVVVSVAGSVLAQEQTLVLPSGTENQPGDYAATIVDGGSLRFQQFFSSDVLAAEMPTEAWITGVSFRQDDRRGFTGEVSFESVEVIMSTTDRNFRSVDPISAFADNLGPGAQVVVPRGPVAWSVRHIPGAANPFDAKVTFLTPFVYNPNRGDLLIDVRFMNVSRRLDLDVHSSLHVPTDVGFFVWGRPGDPPGNFSGLDFGYLTGGAFVVQLTFVSIPEPTGLSLLGTGFTVFVFSLRRSVREPIDQQ
jgi:hypothetical protein